MPVEKDKVLAAIESKFKGKSITKTFKENIAAKWAAKIDNDTEIDAYIEDREEVVLEAVSEADRRATAAVEKVKKETQPEKKEEVESKEVELPADTPEWAKALITQNKTLEAKINGFESAQQAKTIEQRFKSDERLKGIPEMLLKRAIPKTEDEYEATVTELANEYSTFATEQKITSFGNDKPGGASGQPSGGKKEASKEELDAVMANVKI